MKTGKEAEGLFQGVETLFCNAADVLEHPDRIRELLKENSITHLYVSDRMNFLDYAKVGKDFDVMITMDISSPKLNCERPANVKLMWTMPTALWDAYSTLRPDDQVKFHSEDRHVDCFVKVDAVRTYPKDFEGDIEV